MDISLQNITNESYKNSKYRLPYTQNSILDSVFLSHNIPCDLNLSDQKSLDKFSSGEIKKLFYCFVMSDEKKEEETKNILRKVRCGNDASNISMILDLVHDKKLPPTILLGADGKISKNAENDLDKLYDAYINKSDVKKVFVPDIKNEEDIKKLDTGDVCRYKNNKNISIKTEDGFLKELFITPETYLELFPPVERFCFSQSRLGDCYLISAIDSVFQNKKTRHKILEMFLEHNDGTVDVSYSGYIRGGENIYLKDSSFSVLKNIQKNIENAPLNYVAYAPEGLRAIEILNEAEACHKSSKEIDFQYETYKKLISKMNEKPNIFYNGFKYTKNELEYFINLYEKGGRNAFISMAQTNNPTLALNSKDARIALLKLFFEKNKDINSVFEKMLLQRYIDRMKREKQNNIEMTEILPKELYYTIFDTKNKNTPFLYSEGGTSDVIYEKLGFESSVLPVKSGIADFILCDKDADSKYLLTAHSVAKKSDVAQNHSYSVSVKNEGSKLTYIVRNPNNALFEKEYSYEDFCSNFDEITFARIG